MTISQSSRIITSTTLYTLSFNPFERRTNTNGYWVSSDLGPFYQFVEEQKLLTAAQELNYGKAIYLQKKIDLIRDAIKIDNINNYIAVHNNIDDPLTQQRDDVINTATQLIKIISGKKEDGDVRNIEEASSSLPISLEDYSKLMTVSDEEVARNLSCSVASVRKTAKYAELSKKKLMNSNLKLVLSVVSRYRSTSISNAELIAEGTRGLAKAVLRYDYSKGFRFATYATWYIHEAVATYARFRKNICKMPSKYEDINRKLKLFTNEYKLNNPGKYPSVSELSEGLDEKPFDILKVLSMYQYPALSNSPAQRNTIQLTKASDPNTGSPQRVYADIMKTTQQSPVAVRHEGDSRKSLETILSSELNEIERTIMRSKYGLSDEGMDLKIKQIGKKHSLTWSVVKQIEMRAMEKLINSQQMTDFVDKYSIDA